MKQKTKKSVAKKVRITKNGKVIRRKTKQNHFNVRESKKFKRAKRSDVIVFEGDAKNIIKALPYA